MAGTVAWYACAGLISSQDSSIDGFEDGILQIFDPSPLEGRSVVIGFLPDATAEQAQHVGNKRWAGPTVPYRTCFFFKALRAVLLPPDMALSAFEQSIVHWTAPVEISSCP